MSFKKTGSHYDKNLKEWLEHFEAEYESDVSALPPANPGSTCFIKETGKTVKLAYNGVWGGPEQPFGYSTTTVKEVLAECQGEWVEEFGFYGCGTGKISLEIGQKYTVVINGTEYTGTGFDASAAGEFFDVGIVNDGADMSTGDGLEFVVFRLALEQADYAVLARLGDDSPINTISIRQEVTEVKKISGKYVEGMGWSEEGNTVVICFFNDDGVECVNGNNTSFFPSEDIVDGFVRVADPVPADKVKTIVVNGTKTYKVADLYDAFMNAGVINDAYAFFDHVVITYADNTDIDGTVLAKAGLYVYVGLLVYEGTSTVTFDSETIHPIDQKFLPSGGGNVVTAIFKSSDYDNFISGLAPAAALEPEVKYSCENMSFAEAVESILGGKALECYFKFVNDSQAVSMPFVPRFYIDSNMNSPRIKLTPVYAELWNGDKTELTWYNSGSKDSVL